ncbi:MULTISPECIES: PepSY-associated TM helix domain-containing protein [Kordiimonas]|uniref:PepSY-associated TM helix domain-containing protein n=1 Tax=Kordiimonas TaxID=288021 RepID=UPI00257DF905|nr:PepSY-associated TM helix domain-containing protein [Kordiimonas sp. UBA4487]
MRKTMKRVHQLIGLVGALYMILMALTGTILAFEDQLLRLAVPRLEQSVVPLDADQQGTVLETIEARYDAYQLLSIKLPYPGMNAYRIYERGHGSYLLDPRTLKPIDDPLNVDAALQFLFDLHHSLALGLWGEEAVALLGLVAFFLVLSGLYLWWPWRKGFRLKLLKPKNGRSSALRATHATSGILITPLLLLLIGTGVGMMYGTPIRSALGAVFGGDQPVNMHAVSNGNPATLLTMAGDHFAEARVTLYRPARQPGDPVGLRLQMPAEMHPNGRTTVTVGQQGGQSYDATKAGLGHRIADSFYPLHSGKTGGLPYLLLVVFTGLGTLYLAGMGLTAYVRRR